MAAKGPCQRSALLGWPLPWAGGEQQVCEMCVVRCQRPPGSAGTFQDLQPLRCILLRVPWVELRAARGEGESTCVCLPEEGPGQAMSTWIPERLTLRLGSNPHPCSDLLSSRLWVTQLSCASASYQTWVTVVLTCGLQGGYENSVLRGQAASFTAGRWACSRAAAAVAASAGDGSDIRSGWVDESVWSEVPSL